ncbi:4-hydroxythreonine-4-phosphate dehydrogenase PdxA [Litorivicinus lipolyticus]|uniref:4-hydroxythreonine-4-phosphate dehydrogenase PdxA n=1 Tax=Litorivicinus lipolyticus TaxID=418701 RepID=A0A5Q2QHS0_9GAMM|nr:4-hydroxythreonine-4-phosphate dehydrogenase PdxA [Litorivicinus lipolyticus]QGG80575.1 4-hydroxythreonine-4-phosphate dehydrogenase PdxA [Litorivicinus lipolyticus]
MLGLTMGDPAGIGPEIICKAWSSLDGPRVVYGDACVMMQAIEQFAPHLTLRRVRHTELATLGHQDATLALIESSAFAATPEPGKVTAACGEAAYAAITNAISDARDGLIDGMVTAPIHKQALHLAGVDYPGHTEMLQDLTGVPEVGMVLANDELAVILATTHCSMREALDRIAQGAVGHTLRLAAIAGRDLGFDQPRIAVAGVNPHAGEGGLFGDEEQRFIEPAIAQARAGGMDVTGPLAGDTVFMRARQGEFDLVVAMYHDQGLIPVKYLGVDAGVNMTVGLPFVRTSPDHGTAFDKAWQGVADESAFIYAYRHARRVLSRGSASTAAG